MKLVQWAVCLLFVFAVSIPSSASGDDWDRNEKFRTRKLNLVWEEAVKTLKGDKLKSLTAELKAHEKLVLTLKKKRHTLDLDIEGDGGADGSSGMSRLQEVNRQQAEDELNLEQDLERILARYHLNVASAALHSRSAKKDGDGDTVFDDSHINHINSVLPSSRDGDVYSRKFEEPHVESLYHRAKDLASRVLDEASNESDKSKGKSRTKSIEAWLLSLEQDLDVLEGRLRKARFLESELDRYKKKVIPENKYLQNQEGHESNHLNPHHDPGNDLSGSDEIKTRLKSLQYKIAKSEKELGDRIAQRKREEFPTSRSEGDL